MNGNFDDDEAIQNEKERNTSGILQGVDHFSSTQERGIYGEKERQLKEVVSIRPKTFTTLHSCQTQSLTNFYYIIF